MNYSGIMTLPVTDTTPEMLVALAEAMRGQVIDGVLIHDAVAELVPRVDTAQIVHLYVLLDDPIRPATTWPTETCSRVGDLAYREGGHIGIEEYVLTTPFGVSDAALVGLSPAANGQ